MKRQKLDIKKIIKKKIEFRHSKYVVIDSSQKKDIIGENKKNNNVFKKIDSVAPIPVKLKLENDMSRQNNHIRIYGDAPLTLKNVKINKHILFDACNENIVLSVAIPSYNGKKIGWLSMEGLCNQINVDFDWEILICEEFHENMLGEDFFSQYSERLFNAGCKKITYIELSDWVNLAEKWKIIGQNLDNYNGGFLLQAIDDYSPSERLSITNQIINENNYDWLDFSSAYFYDFISEKLIMYCGKNGTNVNIAFKSYYAKLLQSTTKNRGIDGFLYDTIRHINPKIKRITLDKLLPDGVFTDGYNNISKTRKNYYNTIRMPFICVNDKIDTIKLPEYVVLKIKELNGK